MLENLIRESGIKKGFISEQMGITRASFANKINNRSEFTGSQIKAITDILKLTQEQRESIFFS